MKIGDILGEAIDWDELKALGAVMPYLYKSPGKPPPSASSPNIITKYNLEKEKLAPGETLTPIKNMPNWQKYMDDWWASEKNKPEAKTKVDQIRWSAKQVNKPIREINENFADGKKKGKSRPGRVKRSGASCKGSVTSLRAKARKYSGEKGKMYHWCANMKGGRKKK